MHKRSILDDGDYIQIYSDIFRNSQIIMRMKDEHPPIGRPRGGLDSH